MDFRIFLQEFGTDCLVSFTVVIWVHVYRPAIQATPECRVVCRPDGEGAGPVVTRCYTLSQAHHLVTLSSQQSALSSQQSELSFQPPVLTREITEG